MHFIETEKASVNSDARVVQSACFFDGGAFSAEVVLKKRDVLCLSVCSVKVLLLFLWRCERD